MKTLNYNYAPNVGLAIVLLWVAGMKFTAYEAEAISGLVANSPLISWVYNVFSQRTTSALIGVSEIIVAVLILMQPWKPKLAFLGGLGAIGTFATTLSFLLSTPGMWEASLGGFPAISVMPGQFVLKDIALISVALWITLSAKEAIGRKDSADSTGSHPVAL